MNLILASLSPYRKLLLDRLGIPFVAVDPGVDEDFYKAQGLSPIELAETLARAKASAVLAKHPEAVVIGGDQLVSFDGSVLGKPGTAERAVEQLLSLAGREHQLITSLAVADHSGVETFTEVTTLQLRALDRDEAERYVASDNPIDCAGSYKIEALGIALFDRIETNDFTAIVGMPLMALSGILRQRGWRVP